MATLTDLAPGDLIEIRYRTAAAHGDSDSDALRDRWVAAVVKSVDSGVWPLARLADGQLTEVRRFMEWRYASGYLRPPRPHPRSA